MLDSMDSIDLARLCAFVFGLAVGVHADPVARRLWDRRLSREIRAARDLALGAAVAQFTIAVVAVAAATRLRAWLVVEPTLSIGASATLLTLGAFLAADALFRTTPSGEDLRLATGNQAFPAAYRIMILNARPWLLTLAFAAQLPHPDNWEEGPRYAVLIFLGYMMALLSHALLARMVDKPMSKSWSRAANLVAALIIGALATYGLLGS